MSDTSNNLGADGTIPNTDDGIAVGHDPDGSHFNQEEEAPATTAADTTGADDSADQLKTSGDEEAGSYTDTAGDDREDRPAEASGSYTDIDE